MTLTARDTRFFSLSMRALAGSLLLAAMSCKQLSTDDKRACETDNDCLSGYSCVDKMCVSSEGSSRLECDGGDCTDANALGAEDSGMLDASDVDASTKMELLDSSTSDACTDDVCGDAATCSGPFCGEGVVQISAGFAFTCARSAAGLVKCWGDNTRGQLGQGDLVDRGDDPDEMGNHLAPINLGSGLRVQHVTAGRKHACALLEDGRVKCWGQNYLGNLGIGTRCSSACGTLEEVYDVRGDEPGEMGDALPFVDLGTGRTAIRVDAGGDRTCALLDNGRIKCWGNNAWGRLGTGTGCLVADCSVESVYDHRGDEPNEMGDNLAYVDLGAGVKATAIAVGDKQACAVLADGKVKCWGSGALGLGDMAFHGDEPGEMGASLDAVDLGVSTKAKALCAGTDVSCALLEDGKVKCWGSNEHGALATADTIHHGFDPDTMGTKLPFAKLGTSYVATALECSGLQAVCAVFDDESLKCWGNNANGKLGVGDTEPLGVIGSELDDALKKLDLGSSAKVVGVTTGEEHACALLDTADVKCWGLNVFGQLGLGDKDSRGDDSGEMGSALLAAPLDL